MTTTQIVPGRSVHLNVTVGDGNPESTLQCAQALYAMAASQTGASVIDLELGEAALDEFIDALHAEHRVSHLSITSSEGGFELVFTFEPAPLPLSLTEGTEQVIDAGFDHWSVTRGAATIRLHHDRR